MELKRDLIITEGVLDVLDHAAPNALFGGKLGIDATGKGGPALPEPVRVAADELLGALRKTMGFSLVRSRWQDRRPLILLRVAKGEGKRGPTSRSYSWKAVSFHLVPSASFRPVVTLPTRALLWKAFPNVDPVRDVVTRGERAVMTRRTRRVTFPVAGPGPMLS